MKSSWFSGGLGLSMMFYALLPSAVFAFDSCLAPDEPACINSRYAFENDLVATRCRREVDRYVRDIQGYTACIEQVREEYLQRANTIMTRLNCRVRGELRC